MPSWIIECRDGTLEQLLTNGSNPGDEGVDLGIRHAETPRQLERGERWNWADNCIEIDADEMAVHQAAQIDAEFGREHIARAHALKAIEARLILAGLGHSSFILYREAEALSIPLEDLAREVLLRSAASDDAEIERRERKVTIRPDDSGGQ